MPINCRFRSRRNYAPDINQVFEPLYVKACQLRAFSSLREILVGNRVPDDIMRRPDTSRRITPRIKPLGGLLVRCPNTQQVHSVPIKTDPASLAKTWSSKFTILCLHCGKEHDFQVRDVYIDAIFLDEGLGSCLPAKVRNKAIPDWCEGPRAACRAVGGRSTRPRSTRPRTPTSRAQSRACRRLYRRFQSEPPSPRRGWAALAAPAPGVARVNRRDLRKIGRRQETCRSDSRRNGPKQGVFSPQRKVRSGHGLERQLSLQGLATG